MFEVFLTSRAERDLKVFPQNLRPKFYALLESLEFNYFPDYQDVKKLKGAENSYRVRFGDWRVVYTVDFEKKRIFVGHILPRKIVYRKQ